MEMCYALSLSLALTVCALYWKLEEVAHIDITIETNIMANKLCKRKKKKTHIELKL